MKKSCIALLCLMFVAIGLPFSQAQAQVQVYDVQLGKSISNILTVAQFHFSLSLGSRNRALINEALIREQMRLQPGQEENCYLIATGSPKHPVFQRLLRESDGFLLSGSEWIVGRVTLRSNRYVWSAISMALPIPSRSEFNNGIRNAFSSKVTYDDYVFLIRTVNTMLTAQRVGNSQMYDLLDEGAYAGVDGTVILTARKSENTYNVYDVANGQEDKTDYKKGAGISRLGSTVWVLCQSDKGEYVVVYSNLKEIHVDVGDRVRAGSTSIGKWGNVQHKGFSLYRVHGPEQYFLRPIGSPAPYSVLFN